MRPVDQRIQDNVNGDCLAACIASILEVSIDDVPPIIVSEHGTWMTEIATWLAARGYALVYVANIPPLSPKGYHIASDGEHACVALDGVIVHDPHVLKQGLDCIVRRWLLVRFEMLFSIERA